jgi:hypothetical protein
MDGISKHEGRCHQGCGCMISGKRHIKHVSVSRSVQDLKRLLGTMRTCGANLVDFSKSAYCRLETLVCMS